MSKIDVAVNKAIHMVFLTDVILVTISALLLLQFEAAYFSSLTYLGYYVPGVTPEWAVTARPDGMQWEEARSTFIQGFLTFIVLFNNFGTCSLSVINCNPIRGTPCLSKTNSHHRPLPPTSHPYSPH